MGVCMNFFVPRERLELSRSYEHWILNPACLPISAPRLISVIIPVLRVEFETRSLDLPCSFPWAYYPLGLFSIRLPRYPSADSVNSPQASSRFFAMTQSAKLENEIYKENCTGTLSISFISEACERDYRVN